MRWELFPLGKSCNKFTPWRYLVYNYSYNFLEFVINWMHLAQYI